MFVFLQKILILFVIHNLLFQQEILSGPLPWEASTRSASVLPYHVGGGHVSVLLSEKTYEDPTHRRTFWSDFGGNTEEGESPQETASRELAEETLGMISVRPEDLLNCSLHEISMQNSPFSRTRETVTHTIFFSQMENRDIPVLPEEASRTPEKNGTGEISRYVWISVEDLLRLQAPSLFGSVIGKHFPKEFGSLRLDTASKVACLLAPFFVLLQQTDVKGFFFNPTKKRQSFSQIQFTGMGTFDWKLVHSGFFTQVGPDPQQFLEKKSDWPSLSLELIHKPHRQTDLHFPYEENSPNFWQLSHRFPENEGLADPQEGILNRIQQFMGSYTAKMRVLTALKNYFLKLPDDKKKRPPPQERSEEHPNSWEHLPPASDTYLNYLLERNPNPDPAKAEFVASLFREIEIPPLSDRAQKVAETSKNLRKYTEKAKQMRPDTDPKDLEDPNFAVSVAQVLEAERRNPECVFLYHACSPEVSFLQALYRALLTRLGLNPKSDVCWRFFDRVPGRYPTARSAFADAAQSEGQRQPYVNPNELLVAANLFLFGNPGHPGCNTLMYWRRSESENSIDLRRKIEEVFSSLNVPLDQNIINALIIIFEENYFVSASQGHSFSRKFPVGTLRQMAFFPEDAEKAFSLSGWFFGTPLSFNDIQLSQGEIYSIYTGLEEGDKAWMADLSPTLRLLAHVRAGDAQALKERIRRYHELAPTGGIHFNIDDCEIRVGVDSDPAWIRTHYYPSSSQDGKREETVANSIEEIFRLTFQNMPLPVMSFRDPFCRHAMLACMMSYHLGVTILPPIVSVEQFKGAVGQGDLETMKLFLNTPHDSIQAKDLRSGRMSSFTIADYVSMIASKNSMAGPVCRSLLETHPSLLKEGTKLRDTPYALEVCLETHGLNGLTKLKWPGDLDNTNFDLPGDLSTDEDHEDGQDSDTEDGVPRIINHSTVRDLFSNKNIWSHRQSRQAGSKTNFFELPPLFWRDLSIPDHLERFFGSGFVGQFTTEFFERVLSQLKITEEDFYRTFWKACLNIFKHQVSSDEEEDDLIKPQEIEEILLIRILTGVQNHVDSMTILNTLKNLKGQFNFLLMHTREPGYSCMSVFDIFRRANLLDGSWNEFKSVLYEHARQDSAFQVPLPSLGLISIAELNFPLNPWGLWSYPYKILQEILDLEERADLQRLFLNTLFRQEDHPNFFESGDCLDATSHLREDEKTQLRISIYNIFGKFYSPEIIASMINLNPYAAALWLKSQDDKTIQKIVGNPFSLEALKKFDCSVFSGRDSDRFRGLYFSTFDSVLEIFQVRQPSQFSLWHRIDPKRFSWLYNMLQPYLRGIFDRFFTDITFFYPEHGGWKSPSKEYYFQLPSWMFSMFYRERFKMPDQLAFLSLEKAAFCLGPYSAFFLTPEDFVKILIDERINTYAICSRSRNLCPWERRENSYAEPENSVGTTHVFESHEVDEGFETVRSSILDSLKGKNISIFHSSMMKIETYYAPNDIMVGESKRVKEFFQWLLINLNTSESLMIDLGLGV